jgi:hypothetical protein
MFTGFASENTPAIQVWDFFTTFANTSAVRSVSLADDCAPIQVFRTGATGQSAIRVYLPTAPIEGKQITIVNQQYGLNPQKVSIYSSDTSGAGTSNALFTLGSADSLVLLYSKQNISFGENIGIASTGWISLNRSSLTSGNSYAAIVGGDNNAASAQYSFVGGGNANSASNTSAAVVGGSSHTASGTSAVVAGGSSHFATGSNSGVFAGSNNNATSESSVILGGRYSTTRSISGMTILPASVNPLGFVQGISQTGVLLIARQTTDATPGVLRSTTSVASTTNQVILPNNSAYTFQGTCVANVTGGGNTSGWKFEGVIKRGANAASTTLVAAVTPTVIAQDAGAVTWVLAVTADTTNGGIAVTVTGQAATTIRWVCKIETTEVTF